MLSWSPLRLWHGGFTLCFIRLLLIHALISEKKTWWRHQMETFTALLAIWAGNSPVPGEFPSQRPVTRSFDVIFDLRLNKRLSKQSWGWWFESRSCPLWRHCNEIMLKGPILNPKPETNSQYKRVGNKCRSPTGFRHNVFHTYLPCFFLLQGVN